MSEKPVGVGFDHYTWSADERREHFQGVIDTLDKLLSYPCESARDVTLTLPSDVSRRVGLYYNADWHTVYFRNAMLFEQGKTLIAHAREKTDYLFEHGQILEQICLLESIGLYYKDTQRNYFHRPSFYMEIPGQSEGLVDSIARRHAVVSALTQFIRYCYDGLHFGNLIRNTLGEYDHAKLLVFNDTLREWSPALDDNSDYNPPQWCKPQAWVVTWSSEHKWNVLVPSFHPYEASILSRAMSFDLFMTPPVVYTTNRKGHMPTITQLNTRSFFDLQKRNDILYGFLKEYAP